MIPSGTKFVGINPDFPTAERKSAQNNAAQDVYTIEDIALQISPTLQQVSDTGGLHNGSTIRQGSVDRFGLNGIETVCSEDKRIQWVNGVERYYYLSDSTPHSNSMNGDIPDTNYDISQGFNVGNFYNSLALGKTFICLDATSGEALWLPLGGEYTPTLYSFEGSIVSAYISKAFYNINNGIAEVTFSGEAIVDFSTNQSGIFTFTLPTLGTQNCYGTVSFRTPQLINGIIGGENLIRFESNDITFSGPVEFVAKFTYQAY